MNHITTHASPIDLRDRPTEAFIEDLRRRFPTEPETDALLTRKMHRRADGPYRHVSLDEMGKSLHALLRAEIGSDYCATGLRWLTGGASKIQLAFELEWNDQGVARRESFVIRMDPSEASNTTSRKREVELLRAFDGILPVPRVFWLDEDGTYFPEPAIVYSFVPGTTKPKASKSGSVVGLGTNFGSRLRSVLAPQFLECLAKIHAMDISDMSFDSMEVPEEGTTQGARWQLNRARRVWEEDRGEDFPLMDVAANWLEQELPVVDKVSVVHGDYRSGNFLFEEETGQITAWLDWERAHLGDRHRDLAWMTQREKGHMADDGKTYLVCGLIPLEDFYERYEAVSGLSVDLERVTYYRVLNCFQSITTTMATAYRVARNSKSHQDVLLARLKGVAPVIEHELCELLEEVL